MRFDVLFVSNTKRPRGSFTWLRKLSMVKPRESNSPKGYLLEWLAWKHWLSFCVSAGRICLEPFDQSGVQGPSVPSDNCLSQPSRSQAFPWKPTLAKLRREALETASETNGKPTPPHPTPPQKNSKRGFEGTENPFTIFSINQ